MSTKYGHGIYCKYCVRCYYVTLLEGLCLRQSVLESRLFSVPLVDRVGEIQLIMYVIQS